MLTIHATSLDKNAKEHSKDQVRVWLLESLLMALDRKIHLLKWEQARARAKLAEVEIENKAKISRIEEVLRRHEALRFNGT